LGAFAQQKRDGRVTSGVGRVGRTLLRGVDRRDRRVGGLLGLIRKRREVLLRRGRTRFEHDLSGSDHRSRVLQRGVVVFLRGRGHRRRLLDDRFLQVLRFDDRFLDERLCLLHRFLHRVGGDRLNLFGLFHRLVEEVHWVVSLGCGVVAADGEDPAQRAGVLVELARGAAQGPERGIGSFLVTARALDLFHVRENAAELNLDGVPAFGERRLRRVRQTVQHRRRCDAVEAHRELKPGERVIARTADKARKQVHQAWIHGAA
jgi:hypothetical protein